MFKKKVYISHPYSGKDTNKRYVENIIKSLIKKYPAYLFLSPIHTFGYLYNYVDYQVGLQYCIWLLRKADEMWVFGNYQNSRGCLIEIRVCEENNIKYYIKGTKL